MKIIKYTFVIILFVMITNTAKSQFIYGPHVGVGISTLDNANMMGVSAELGLFIRAELLDRFGFQPEFIYSLKTGSSEDATTPITKHNYTSHFFEIPVLVFFPLSSHISIQAGPNFAFGISGDHKETFDGTSTNDSYTPGGGIGIAAGFVFETGSRLKFGFQYRSTGGGSTSMMVTTSYLLDW